MLIDEQSDRSMIKTESQYVIFIEDESPNRSEVDRSLEFHKIVSQEENSPRDVVENEEKFFQTPKNYESNLSSSDSTTIGNQSQQD